jgi:hypothetical protein
MKMLFSSQIAPEVGLLKGLLDDEGIACEVRNESSSANFPGAAFQPELWVVSDADYERACEVRDACWQSTAAGTPPSTESYRGLYMFIGFVSLAGGIVLLWQGARTGDLVAIGAAFGVCGFLSVVSFIAGGQLRFPKRTK